MVDLPACVSADPPSTIVDVAIYEGSMSPCSKSKRGSAIWISTSDGGVIPKSTVYAHNRPPRPFTCNGSVSCKANCRYVCGHAETLAALQFTSDATHWAHCLHVKVVRDPQHPQGARLVPSGPPSCAMCSGNLLAAGIDFVWLYHDTGWKAYTAVEFHRLSLENNKLFCAESS